MAKKKPGKSQRSGGWDFFRITRKLMKKRNFKVISGISGGLLAAGGLAALFQVKRNTKNERLQIFKPLYLIVAGLCLLLILYGIYSMAYANKSFPHVLVAGVKVGGKNKTEINRSLDVTFKKYEAKPVKFIYKDKIWQLNPNDIKLTYDKNKTEQAVYTIGREKTFFGRMWSRLGLVYRAHEVKPIYSFDNKALSDFISKIASDTDVPEKDATGVIKNNNVTFVAERTGTRVEQSKLKAEILTNFDHFSSQDIKVPIKTSYPNVTLGDTESARQTVLTMLKSKLTLKWQKGSWNVGPDVFSSWIKFKSVAVEGSKGSYQLAAYIDNNEVGDYLKKISKDIDKTPQNAKLGIVNNQLTVTSPSVTGYAFDQQTSTAPIIEAIQSGTTKDIQLSVKEVDPDVTNDNFSNLGITEIIGSGATNFKGSSDARKANVANGARIVNGTLIKPGEEFSAVKTIGNVDASTGFVLGLVIKGNKTQPEYGGGLCQISSTLFRAALYTGLRVTERAAHAYRVGYYETDGNGKRIGPGLDSTIYGPHPDLRFVNDTGHYILIQGHIEKTKLTFDFWGTRDGRIATVSAPTISDEKPAPPDEYINTDTLFVGQKEQTETSHPGATVVINYTVMREGKEIIKQTFRSKYKPWGAKYLVGTKPAPVAPAPTAPTVTPTATPVEPTVTVTPTP